MLLYTPNKYNAISLRKKQSIKTRINRLLVRATHDFMFPNVRILSFPYIINHIQGTPTDANRECLLHYILWVSKKFFSISRVFCS